MDYIGILKRAWNVTWKHKILWLFGLFAGAGGAARGNFNFNGGGGGGGGGTGGQGTGTAEFDAVWRAIEQQADKALPFIAAAIGLLFLIALVFLVLGIAAQGGLVHLVNEAEEGRPVKAGDGWSVGFKRWWRVLWLRVLITLPFLALTLVFLLLFGATIVGMVASFGRGDAGTAAGVAGAFGACLGLVVFVTVVFVLGVILGVAGELALRYAILEDRSAWASLKQGWADLWAKRGGFLMYLVMYVTGIVFGLIVGVVGLMIAGPAIVMLVLGNLVGFAVLMVLAFAISLLPSAVYGAFFSAAWTIFFRRMTGREKVAAAPAAAPATPSWQQMPAPPPPPSAPDLPPVPEAPPMPEAPPIPEAPPMPEPPAVPGAEPAVEAARPPEAAAEAPPVGGETGQEPPEGA